MKADIVLFISSEHPLMQQLQKLFGKDCFMRDFVTIDKNEKYVTLRHIDTGRLVAYTSEDRLQAKRANNPANVSLSSLRATEAGYVLISLPANISRVRAEVSSSL